MYRAFFSLFLFKFAAEMEKELREIYNQLTALTRKVEALLNSCEASPPESAPEPVPVPEPVTESIPASITFTLNDRFRFQRAIFGGSAERMANAMSAISAMTTADEVYAYLTNVLDQNIEEPDVEDFFRTVTLRFADHKPLML